MTLTEWLRLFVRQVAETPFLQWAGVGFGVAEVLLARANKAALYPCGIISILITLYTLYITGLYAEVALNAYYLVMSIYGWWLWIKRKGSPAVKISYATAGEWAVTAGIVITAFVLFYITLKHYTDSEVPLWDSWVSATAWAGMWLLARRKIENWLLLNISNAFALPLLLHKGLPLYALLTFVLFIIAIAGYFDWKKSLVKRTSHPLPDYIV